MVTYEKATFLYLHDMKIILLILLLPMVGYSQPDQSPEPIISLVRIELKKDTLFVYRHLKWPPHNMSVAQEWLEYNDREVYVVGKGKEIVLVAVERAKIRKIKVDTEEEYW